MTYDESQPPPQLADVVPLFGAQRKPAPPREAPVTPEEIAEYRQIRPALLRMLAEWEQLTAAHSGCPVAAQILRGR